MADPDATVQQASQAAQKYAGSSAVWSDPIARAEIRKPWDGLDAAALVDEIVWGDGLFAWVRGQLKIRLTLPPPKRMTPNKAGAMKSVAKET